MLSRAALPLTRPNVFASAFRASSALSAQQPRWYAQGKGSAPYNLPESMQSEEKAKKRKSTQKPQEAQYAAEQPEFDTKAQPETAKPVCFLHLNSIPIPQFIGLFRRTALLTCNCL